MSNLCKPVAVDCALVTANVPLDAYEFTNQVVNNPDDPLYWNGAAIDHHLGRTVFGDEKLTFPYYGRVLLVNGTYDNPASSEIGRPAGFTAYLRDEVEAGLITGLQAHLMAHILNASERGWTILPLTRPNHVESLVRVGKFSFIFRGQDSGGDPYNDQIYSIHDLAGTDDAMIQDDVAPLPRVDLEDPFGTKRIKNMQMLQFLPAEPKG